VEEFTAAVRRVAEGGLVLDQEVKERLLGGHAVDKSR